MQKGKETPASELEGFGRYYSQGKDYYFSNRTSRRQITINANNKDEAWQKLEAKVVDSSGWLISS